MIYKFLFFIAFNLFLNLQAQAQTFGSEKHDYKVEVLFSDLNSPWGMDFLDDERLLITEKSGQLNLVNLSTKSIEALHGLPEIREYGQGGLMDVLVHPDDSNNHWIYLSHINKKGSKYGTEVLRAEVSGKTLTNIQNIFIAQPKVSGTRHFGSRLAIDHQGYLYISLGDRGDRHSAQNLDSHLGSLIRLHDDGTIPQDNPFVSKPGALEEIFSFGHRNIQGLTIRESDKSLWLHEHGPQGGDELNRPQNGKNFGWPVITYGVNYGIGSKIGEGTEKPGMEQPIYYWVPSIAPSGMMFYESDKFPNWKNNLFIGSLKFASLVRLELDSNEVIHEERLLSNKFGRIRDVIQGNDGCIYVLTDAGNGKLLKLSPL